jgi:Uncharacterized conserved protein
MCGRIVQKSPQAEYVETIFTNLGLIFDDAQAPRYNIPPGTRVLALHRLGGSPAVEHLWWGYGPPWWRRQPVINARIDTLLRGSAMWRPLLVRRVIVPADGWYEWTPEGDGKAPWYIHPRDARPIYLPGITAWQPGRDHGPETGMAIITDDAAGGMIDVHDRRPVVLTAEAAREWIDPATPVDAALELLTVARPESAFQWHRVSKRMNSARYQLPDALAPI